MRPEDSAQEGEEILVFYGGDVRPEDGALARIADYFARHPETILAYADEDERLEENGGRRTNPWLKPDWSPDTLMSYFYFGPAGQPAPNEDHVGATGHDGLQAGLFDGAQAGHLAADVVWR